MDARTCRLHLRTTLAIAAAVLLFPARAALGLSLTVNSTVDEPAGDATDAGCISFPSGKCTLRAAIMVANYHAGPHTIAIPAGTYTLTRAGFDDGALVGDLDIAHDTTIQGAGSAATIIDGNGPVTQDRVFQVLPSATSVTLSGITIKNGKSVASTVGIIGGGGLYIEGAGQVQLSDVIVDGNTATNGGGIYANFSASGGSLLLGHVLVRNNTATAGGVGAGAGVYAYMPSSLSQTSVQDSQVYGNTADGTGGGFYLDGGANTLTTIERSEIYSNTAASAGGIGILTPLALSDSHVHDNHANLDGGAIEAFAAYSILRSTLDANVCGRNGGAIFNLQTGGNGPFPEFAHIEQSTLSGNFGPTGGAIYHDGFITPGSTLMIVNSTVAGNVAAGGFGGAGLYLYGGETYLLSATVAGNHVSLGGGPGGGVYLAGAADFKARNSLIANNWHNGTVLQGQIPDDGYTNNADGTITGELAYDLIQTTTNFTVSGPQGGNILGQDPVLGPLQYNGGPTQTRALLAGSPAIDAGAPAGCMKDAAALTPLSTDQRGAPRPYPAGGRCDIGAFEVGPQVTLDIDGSGSATKYDALTDGLLALRYMFGLSGSALTSGALGATATRTDPAVLKSYLDANRWVFDIDGDANTDALTDGLLIIRYLFGLRGSALIQGAIAPGAPRNTSALIEGYLGSLTP